MTEIKLAGVPLTRVNDTEIQQRLSIMMWGASGCGKTTLASTAPGKKLLINFDHDGPASIRNRDDVIVADFSGERPSITEQFKNESPLGIRKVLEDDPEISTVIIDSTTSAAHLALMHGVSITKGATVERPSPGAYQVRNALTLALIRNMLRTTGRLKRHCIFCAHEASPVTNDDGMVLFITIMLGGQLPNQSTVDFSEVWGISQTDNGQHRIAVRPVRMRRPMKTRCFSTKGKTEFVWKYDPETGEGDGIETWYKKWQENEYKKIAIPK